jgi:hypothetical protein
MAEPVFLMIDGKPWCIAEVASEISKWSLNHHCSHPLYAETRDVRCAYGSHDQAGLDAAERVVKRFRPTARITWGNGEAHDRAVNPEDWVEVDQREARRREQTQLESALARWRRNPNDLLFVRLVAGLSTEEEQERAGESRMGINHDALKNLTGLILMARRKLELTDA